MSVNIRLIVPLVSLALAGSAFAAQDPAPSTDSTHPAKHAKKAHKPKKAKKAAKTQNLTPSPAQH
jgi:hypothetical protein